MVEGVGWREVLEALARSHANGARCHPNLAALFATAVPLGPNSLRGTRADPHRAARARFDEVLAADVYTAVAHQVLASALQEPMNDFRAGGLGTSRA